MAITRARSGAYIWVTWIAPLLAGDAQCLWAAWFKAHFFYDKLNGFDPGQWHAEHAPMVAHSRDMLADDDFAVAEENENKFALRKGDITLAGKPDLIAVNGSRAIVVDCKSGCPHEAHHAQVMTYMAVLPCVRPELRDRELEGWVRYKDQDVVIPADAIDTEFRSRLRTTIHAVGAPIPPARSPSLQECHFCNIGRQDCPDRMDPPNVDPITNHDLF